MKKVTKVLMFVWRRRNGKEEFFVLHRKRGDCVVLTGHVGDNNTGESLTGAARREIVEELGVEPKNIIDLEYKTEVVIKENNQLSTEYAFLVEIPSHKEVKFLEGDEKHCWYALEKLSEVLTHPNQKEPLAKIKKLMATKTKFSPKLREVVKLKNEQ